MNILGSERAVVIVAGACVLPPDIMREHHTSEFVLHGLGHIIRVPVFRNDDTAGVVEDGQTAAPQHQRVVGVGHGHQAPILLLGFKGGIGVGVMHDARARHGDIGDGDDDLRGTLVPGSATVGHIVDPMALSRPDEAFMLAGVPVVAAGVGGSAAVDAS